MKNRVSERLESEGWEVSKEAPIPVGVKYHRHEFLADVLARKDGTSMVVELGQLRGRSIEDIENHVDEAHHIKYETSSATMVDPDVHRIISTVQTFSDHPSIKRLVSDALVEYLDEIDDSVVDMALQKYDYGSIEELEKVVDGSELSKVDSRNLDERLNEIIQS